MTDVEDIRARLPLHLVVGQTVELRKSGAGYVGRCPFHEDREASLSVSNNLFHCFAATCGASGDLFDWIQKMRSCDFQEAIGIARNMTNLPSLPIHNNGQVKQNPKEEPPKPLPADLASEHHKALTPERRQYYNDRGLSNETIDFFQLGWDGSRYCIPVFIGEDLQNIRRRRDDKNNRDKGPKMLNISGHGQAQLFNQGALAGVTDAIVAEGEFDAMLLCQHGWTAVSSTGGAETFLDEWVSLFAQCKTVYICYDHDLAGRTGAAKVAALFGERARIVQLPDEVGDKGDITDYFVKLKRTDADFAELLTTAEPYRAPEPPPIDLPMPVHLAESASATLVGKLVDVKILVAGKLDAPYVVPRKVRYVCYASDKDREKCGVADDDERAGGTWNRVFDDHDSTFIELCHKRKDQLDRILKTAAGCERSCRKVAYDVIEYANVEEFLAVPMADRVIPQIAADGQSTDIDETGNEFVARGLYLLNNKSMVNRYYRAVGRVYPNPNTQLGTILVTQQEPMEDSIGQFSVTDEIRDSFKVFQPTSDANLIAHVDNLILDLTDHVTHIYKRDEALLAVLLGYHSVLSFVFEGRPVRRGWLEVLLLGDTGLGKTEVVRSLIEFCGLGALVSGETSSRTGLTYAVEQVGERWFVKWGKYPLNDRRLLAIDELSELNEEDLGKMTQGRNDGILRVDRVAVAETNCRTRLIWMSNPRFKKGLYDFSHGIESLKTLFPSPADLRRLDLAVLLATKDIDLREINRIHTSPGPQLIGSEVLKQSILWAWSRKTSDIVIDEQTTKAILTEASRLSDRYGDAEDIPLVSPADMRIKLARMAVALAALLHSTDENHEKVIVRPLHVRFIGLYLDSVYQAKNCRYDVYAGYSKKRTTLTPEEASAIGDELQRLETVTGNDVSNVSQNVMELYRQHDVLTATEIADLLDIDRRTCSKRLRVLQHHGLISKTKHGYHKTPKFVEYLSKDE